MESGFIERDYRATQTTFIGQRAIVVGAGIAGLATAAVLADWFERVIVLERDTLPERTEPRIGTPQAWHSHGLLAGGQQALEELFPDIGEDLIREGGVALRFNRDLREEMPNADPMPQRDFGWTGYAMTRPLIESILRHRVLWRPNVVFRERTRALEFIPARDGGRITAVRCARMGASFDETLSGDLIVDASGRGHLTSTLLRSIRRSPLQQTSIGIDLGYTTAVMDIPDDMPRDWKVVLTHHNAPHSTRRAVLLPIEDHRWMMTVSGRGGERPPAEWAGLMNYLQHLITPTIYNAVKNAKPIGRLTRFGLADSVWLHFERVENFPDGLIPVGDAICRFNPIYGQGMSVAARQATLLQGLLRARASEQDSMKGLGRDFLADAKCLIEVPWTMAAIPDFAFSVTRGDRPTDLDHSLQFGKALSRIAARDPAVQKLVAEVWHLLRPRSVYQDAGLVRRVEAEMGQMMAA